MTEALEVLERLRDADPAVRLKAAREVADLALREGDDDAAPAQHLDEGAVQVAACRAEVLHPDPGPHGERHG